MKKNIRSIILLIISILLILVIIVAISFAYYSANVDNVNALNINVSLPNSLYNLTSEANSNISFNVTYEDMKKSAADNTAYLGSQIAYNVDLETYNDNSNVGCSYNLIWVWDSTDQYLTTTNELPFTDGGKTYDKEFTVVATSTTTGDDRDYTTNVINETNISSFVWKDSSDNVIDSTVEGYENTTGTYAVIKNNASIYHNGVGKTSTSWIISVNIYNIYASQNALINKNYQAHIEMQNVICEEV